MSNTQETYNLELNEWERETLAAAVKGTYQWLVANDDDSPDWFSPEDGDGTNQEYSLAWVALKAKLWSHTLAWHGWRGGDPSICFDRRQRDLIRSMICGGRCFPEYQGFPRLDSDKVEPPDGSVEDNAMMILRYKLEVALDFYPERDRAWFESCAGRPAMRPSPV